MDAAKERDVTKPYSISVLRGIGHPWNPSDAHWDMMVAKTTTREALGKIQDGAESNGWEVLCIGFDAPVVGPDDDPLFCAVFYKPQRHPIGTQWQEESPSMWPDPEEWT